MRKFSLFYNKTRSGRSQSDLIKCGIRWSSPWPTPEHRTLRLCGSLAAYQHVSMWLGFLILFQNGDFSVSHKQPRKNGAVTAFDEFFLSHFACSPHTLSLSWSSRRQCRHENGSLKLTKLFFSPCDPAISNVLQRVFLLLPMLESAGRVGGGGCFWNFQEVSLGPMKTLLWSRAGSLSNCYEMPTVLCSQDDLYASFHTTEMLLADCVHGAPRSFFVVVVTLRNRASSETRAIPSHTTLARRASNKPRELFFFFSFFSFTQISRKFYSLWITSELIISPPWRWWIFRWLSSRFVENLRLKLDAEWEQKTSSSVT